MPTSMSSLGNGMLEVMNRLGMESSDFMYAIRGFAYFTGILFLMLGIFMMAKAANPQARHAYGSNAWFWSISAGVLLFALPTTMAVIGGTLFGGMTDTSPMAYATVLDGQMHMGSCQLAGIRPFLAVVGAIAVVRGIIVLRTVGVHGNYSRGNATIGRGVTLCIAGLLLIHMQETLQLINSISPGLKMGEALC